MSPLSAGGLPAPLAPVTDHTEQLTSAFNKTWSAPEKNKNKKRMQCVSVGLIYEVRNSVVAQAKITETALQAAYMKTFDTV